jgi:hypothetical protein
MWSYHYSGKDAIYIKGTQQLFEYDFHNLNGLLYTLGTYNAMKKN